MQDFGFVTNKKRNSAGLIKLVSEINKLINNLLIIKQ